MTDPKRSPSKLRRPFLWLRKQTPTADTPRLTADGERREFFRPWYRPSLLKTAMVELGVLIILPTQAKGQFGIDTAAILAGLAKMQSLMSTYIAAPLKTINKYEQTTAKYEQEVMYPLNAINQAKSSVLQFENQFSNLSGLFHTSVSSATLPQSQNLESTLLSRNTGNVSAVSPQFQSVYGVVMPQDAASPQVRAMTDMTDAQAPAPVPKPWSHHAGARCRNAVAPAAAAPVGYPHPAPVHSPWASVPRPDGSRQT